MSEFNRTVNIYIESGEAQKSYDLLAKKQIELQKQIDGYLAKGKEIPEKLTKQFDAVTSSLDRQAKKLSGELSPSYKDLTGTVTKLTQEVSRMSAQDAGFAKKTKELEEARAAANLYRNSVINVGAAMEKSKEHAEGFGHMVKEVFAGFTLERIFEKGIEAVKEFFSESIKEAQLLEVTQKQLKNSLEGVGRVDALEKLNQQAEGYSKKFSYLYVPEISKVQDALVTFGRLSMNQINDVLPVIINFSAKTGMSMEESSKTILQAMEGNGRALKRFGIEIVKDGGFAQNYGLVMNQLAARVDGAAETFDNTASGALARFGTQMKERQEQLGNELLPILAKTVNGITDVVSALAAAPKFIKENYNAIFLLIGAYVVYNSANIAAAILNVRHTASIAANSVAQIYNATVARLAGMALGVLSAMTNLAQIATALYTGELTIAAAASQALAASTALVSGGLTVIIAAVAAGASVWAYYATQVTEAMKTAAMLADIQATANKNTAEEKSKLEQLLVVARDETITKEKREQAIKAINEISPEYLGNLKLETINTDEARKSIDKYLVSLNKKALTEASGQKRTELNKKLVDEQNKAWVDEMSTIDKGLIRVGAMAQGLEYEDELKKISIATKKGNVFAIEEEIKAYDKWYEAQLKAGNIDIETEGPKHDDDAALRKDQVEKEKQKREKEAYKKFLLEIQKLRDDADNLAMVKSLEDLAGKHSKELAEMDQRYEKELVKEGEFHKKLKTSKTEHQKNINDITAAKNIELEAVLRRQVEESDIQNYDLALKAVDANFAAVKAAKEKEYQEGKIKKIAYEIAIGEIELAHLQTRAFVATDFGHTLKKAKDDEVAFTAAADKQQTDNYIAEIARRIAFEKAYSQSKINELKAKAATGGGRYDETDEKLKAENEWFQQQQKDWAGNEVMLDQITAEHVAKRDQIIQAGWKSTMDEAAKGIQTWGGTLVKGLSAVFKAMDTADNNQLKRDKRANDARVKQWDDQLKKKQISQKIHDALVTQQAEDQDKKDEAIKRKQFNRNKAMQIATAVVNTAAGVLQALGNLPPPASYVMAAITGALGLVEIGTIAAETYADGTPAYKGVMGGSPHSNGGNPIIDSATGMKVGEVEKGEAIIPVDSTANNPDMINYLLTKGRKKNMVNTLRPVGTLDTSRIEQNIHMANGGYWGVAPGSSSASGGSDAHATQQQILMHAAQQTELLRQISEKNNDIVLSDIYKKSKAYIQILKKAV
ncbi:MAG: hypothetical protein JWO03_2876 [Bacteroidetes bacterium]|nr:hypothetical protein [Bacteroidota bacterium]